MQVVGPAQEVGAVLGADAEGVADHDHRQVGGDVVDEVGLALLADRVEDLGAGLLDHRQALADPAGREALVDEHPPLEVGGVVHVDHHREGALAGPDAAGVTSTVAGSVAMAFTSA